MPAVHEEYFDKISLKLALYRDKVKKDCETRTEERKDGGFSEKAAEKGDFQS